MSAALSLEERLSALEKQVARLRAREESKGRQDWVNRVIGSFADCPEFDEVLRLGREFRKEQNAMEDVESGDVEDGK